VTVCDVTCCNLQRVWLGKVVSISSGKYHGMPPNTTSAGAPFSSDPLTRRLDRCFLVGSGHEEHRKFLRVIAGVRRRAGDPNMLTRAELKSCMDACPETSRCLLGCLLAEVLSRALIQLIADRRQVTIRHHPDRDEDFVPDEVRNCEMLVLRLSCAQKDTKASQTAPSTEQVLCACRIL
jgi:hypothetical protein